MALLYGLEPEMFLHHRNAMITFDQAVAELGF
jgi:hypothetical protein